MTEDIAIAKAVEEILQDEADRLDKYQTAAIRKLLNFNTGELLDGRTITSDTDSIELSIPVYGRFQDMKPKGGITSKQSKIYNAPVWGHYQSLGDRLAALYIERTTKTIRSIFPLRL